MSEAGSPPRVTILEARLRGVDDVVFLRKRAHELAVRLGLDDTDRVAVATAAGELARRLEAFPHATIAFTVRGTMLDIEGRFDGTLPLDDGLVTVARDFDEVASEPNCVRVGLRLPSSSRRLDAGAASELRLELLSTSPGDALEELKRQNRLLLATLADRERVQRELRDAEEHLRLATETAGIGTWELTDDETSLALSERARELIDWADSRVPVDAVAARFEDGSRLREALVRLRKGEPFELELRLHESDRWLKITGAHREGRSLGVLLDVTERRLWMEAAAERLELEKQLVGIVSHDLKAPLGAVLMGLGLLRVDPDQQPILERVLGAARRSQRLIHDLLDLTQARLGRGIPVQVRPADLSVVVREAVEQARLAHPDVVLTAETEKVVAPVDPDRLRQIVSNLVSNAIRHGDATRPITVGVTVDRDAAVLSVHNHGPPIPPDQIPRIFRLLSGSEDGGRASLGLGLFIVRALVVAHGGTVSVSSDESGTRFVVRLPLSGADHLGDAMDRCAPGAP